MLRTIRRASTVVALAGAFAIALHATAEAQRPASWAAQPVGVTVVGADYAFTELPTTLRPGPTLFAFENHGTKRHEMSILLLKSGVAVESLMGAVDHPAVSSRAVSDSIVGLLLARPGEHSGGELYVNLVAGRDYVVICTLRDTPDARPHADLGMIGVIRVRETAP